MPAGAPRRARRPRRARALRGGARALRARARQDRRRPLVGAARGRRRHLLPPPARRAPAMVAAPQPGRARRRAPGALAPAGAHRGRVGPRQQHPVGHGAAPRRREAVRAQPQRDRRRSRHDRLRAARAPPRPSGEPGADEAQVGDLRRARPRALRLEDVADGACARALRGHRARRSRPTTARSSTSTGPSALPVGAVTCRQRGRWGRQRWWLHRQTGSLATNHPEFSRLLRDAARQSVRASNVLCGMSQRIAISNLFSLTRDIIGSLDVVDAAPTGLERVPGRPRQDRGLHRARRARGRPRSSTSRAC